MEFIQSAKDTLLNPLQFVAGIVERRHTLPVLANVLIKKEGNSLTLTSTDIEIQIKTVVQLENETTDIIQTTVNAKKFLDIVKSLPNESLLKLNLNESKLAINAGKSKFNLQTLPATDFPEMTLSGQFSEKITLTQKTLKDLINRIHFAMAVQDIRYYLNGMLMILEQNSIATVATDGHRLAFASTYFEQSIAEKKELIIPRKTVMELQRLLQDNEQPVTLEIGSNQIRFQFDAIELTSKLVDGKYPDYKKVIPNDYQNQITLERTELQQALQRVAILSNEKIRGVRCQIENNQLRITSTNTDQENAEEQLDVQYTGATTDIGFNVSYLLDLLGNQKEDTVVLNFGEDASKSVYFTVSNDSSFKYVVMPMRI